MSVNNLGRSSVETRPCNGCGRGTVSKIYLDPPRVFPEHPNHPQMVEYICSNCGPFRLLDCRTKDCSGKVYMSSDGKFYCPVCEQNHVFDENETITIF